MSETDGTLSRRAALKVTATMSAAAAAAVLAPATESRATATGALRDQRSPQRERRHNTLIGVV